MTEKPEQVAKAGLSARKGHWLIEGLQRMRKNRGAVVAGCAVLMFLFLAIVGPMLAPHDPVDTDPPNRFERPTLEHPFGRDHLGRCIFSRVLAGTRVSFFQGFIATGIALFFGGVLGIVAGYYGGVLDHLISRLVDVMMAFPGFLLAVTIVAALGPGIVNCMIAVGVSSIPRFVRLTRSDVLSFREQEFTEAARASGAKDFRIMFRHILPNVVGPLGVYSTLRLSTAILAAAGLSFLGLGAQPPTPEWGAMAAAGRGHLIRHPHMVLFPAAAIFLLVLAFNFLGDGLRDALDPRQSD